MHRWYSTLRIARPSRHQFEKQMYSSQQYPHNTAVNSNNEGSQSQSHSYHQQQPQHYHAPYQQQHHIQQSVATDTSADKDWIPCEKDLEQLNKWFFELDTAGMGYIGGAQAVGFLSNSNLARDTLRIIWGLVDAANVGYIDLHQFYKTIRLVAISSSPMLAGSPPTMERYYATTGMNINLPLMTNAGEDRAVPNVVSSAPSPVGVPTEYVDISDSQQHISHSGHPQGIRAPTPPSSMMTSHNAMPMHMRESVAPTDDVLDMNMAPDPIANDDFEFSDFESASPATNPPLKMSSPRDSLEMPHRPVSHDVNNYGRAHLSTDETSFGDFSGSPPPPSVPVPVYIPTTLSTPIPAVQHRYESTSPVTTSASVEAVPALSVPSITQNGSANARMSFFDDLIESDLQQGGEEWEEFASNDSATGNIAPEEEEVVNPFDVFTSNTNTSDQPDTPETTADTSATVQSSHPTSNPLSEFDKEIETEFDSEFQSSFLPVSVEHTAHRDLDLTSSIFAVPAMSSIPPTLATLATSTIAVTPHGVPDVDNFMSFEDLAPADPGPAHSKETEEGVMEEDFGDFEEADAFQFDTPSVVVQKPLSIPFVATFSPAPLTINQNIPDSRFDTMDLLSMDDPPMPSTLITSSSSSSFAMDNFAPVMDAVFHSSFSPLESALDTRSGGTTAEIFSPSLSPPYETFEIIHSNEKEKENGRCDVKSVNSSSSRTDLSHLCDSSISALEELVCTLVSKDYYEEAHCCLQKVTYLRTVDRLYKEKAEAIDSDDLETAVAIKKKLALLKTSSAGLEDESKWTAAARSVRHGESIGDLVELVGAIDPKKKTWAEKLLKGFEALTGSAPTMMTDRVSKALSVKRYLRMATAVSTTHSKHSQYWLLLLNHVSSAVQNTSNIMDAFNRLQAHDKESVLKCDKMRVFITGSLQIAELGVWVSASCMESMVHEVVAERVVAQCSVFVKAAEAIWSSKVHSYK